MIDLITVFFVLITGIITAILPCTFPVLFGYLGYILGTSYERLSVGNIFQKTFFFFIGFAIVYTFFGSIAGIFGQFTETSIFLGGAFKDIILQIGGVVLIILGLLLMRVIPMPGFLKKVRYLKIPSWLSLEKKSSAIVLGAIFGTGLSPCIGPVLSGVLILAASSSTVLEGAFLLFVFSLGIAIPLFVIAFVYTKLVGSFQSYAEKITKYTSFVGGVLLVLMGLLFLTGFASFLTFISENTFLYEVLERFSI